MRVAALVDAYQSNYRFTNQPMLAEPKPHQLLNNIAREKQDSRAAHLITRLPQGEQAERQYDARDASYIKAELIRRNLLSRKDLMQLYRPPLKKSQMPANNPFTAKTMVSRDFNSAIVRLPKAGPSGKLNGALVPLVPLVPSA